MPLIASWHDTDSSVRCTSGGYDAHSEKLTALRPSATPRAISFDKIEGTNKFLGRGGQTSTQIVLLTKPPKSWTLLPLGESDRPDSPHYDDQARRLFSKGTMKPTHFLDKEALVRNAESKIIIYRETN